MLKIVMIIFFMITGSGLGIYVSSKLTKRRKFFEQMVMLLNSLCAEMSFRQTQLSKLLVNNLQDKEVLSSILNDYILFIDGKKNSYTIPKSFLSDSEYLLTKEMLSTLGRYDITTQMQVLQGYKTRYEQFFDRAKDDELRRGSASRKLGFLSGVLCSVLIL